MSAASQPARKQAQQARPSTPAAQPKPAQPAWRHLTWLAAQVNLQLPSRHHIRKVAAVVVVAGLHVLLEGCVAVAAQPAAGGQRAAEAGQLRAGGAAAVIAAEEEGQLRLLLLRLLPGGRWWLCPNPLPGVGLVTLLQRRRVPILLLLLLRLIIQCFCLALDAGSTRGACPCSCSCCCPPPLLVLVSRCGASTGKAESVLKLHLAIAAGRLLLGLLLLPRLVLCLLLETNPREGHCCCCCCTQCRRGDCAAAAAACCIWGHVGGKNAIPLH